MYHGTQSFKHAIFSDNSRQFSDTQMIDQVLESQSKIKLLDLGCGEGKTCKDFKAKNGNVDWFGVDIEESPEVSRRTELHDRLFSFDGINIPFPDEKFDVIYFNQVLEHVENPYLLFNEIVRVLKPGGQLIGSVSYLETFHSLSIFNVTPYGLVKLANASNLSCKELRPGMDALTLICHRFIRKNAFTKFFFWINKSESFINRIIEHSPLKIPNKTLMKLLFTGHIRFRMEKEQVQLA